MLITPFPKLINFDNQLILIVGAFCKRPHKKGKTPYQSFSDVH
jgi:hypothetical protein